MSSYYRDDVNEIGFGSDSTWARLQSLTESTGRGRDQLFFRLHLLTTETARVSEQYTERLLVVTTETGRASEQYTQSVRATNTVTEKGRGRDALFVRHRTLLEEAGRGSDELLTASLSVLVELARGYDEIIGQRRVTDLVTERAKGSDTLVTMRRTLLEDAARVSDALFGKLRARDLVQELARATDEVIDATKARPAVLTEIARGFDELFGRLHACDLVNDTPAVGWDELVWQGGLIGQAWTADASAWAMSRYAPFAFTGLAVIDGEVYALAPDGVYALGGDSERITAELRTGLMDMTGDVLALPVESHIEYELSEGGKAWVDVTQTQSGKAQTYAYALKGRPLADTLTNARFEFGRGLRGRHFSYALRLEAERAHINDWSVLAMPSKRSL